jgi:hypothetical protein
MLLLCKGVQRVSTCFCSCTALRSIALTLVAEPGVLTPLLAKHALGHKCETLYLPPELPDTNVNTVTYIGYVANK